MLAAPGASAPALAATRVRAGFRLEPERGGIGATSGADPAAGMEHGSRAVGGRWLAVGVPARDLLSRPGGEYRVRPKRRTRRRHQPEE